MSPKVKVTPGIVFNLVLLLGFLAIVISAADYRPAARLFPFAIGIPALILTAIQMVIEQIRAHRPVQAEDFTGLMDLPVDRDTPTGILVRRSAVTFGWVFGLFFGIWLFGFIVTIPLFILLYIAIMAKAKWYETAAMVAIMLAFLVGLFHYILRVPWLIPVIRGPQDFVLSLL